MRGLEIIMPMAGLGSRFASAGFETPKPLIEVDGLPMFRKAITSIDGIKADKTYHFVVRRQHVEEQQLDKLIVGALPDAKITVLPEMTNGAAETAYAVHQQLNPDSGVIVMDCDLWFNSASYNKMVEDSLADVSDIDGGLLTFSSDNPRYSYARFGDDNIVTKTAEKEPISSHAITGAYYFATAANFMTATQSLLAQPLSDTVPEYYLSLAYNSLIAQGSKIQAAVVDQYASFGTPEELLEYQNSRT